MNIPHDRAVLAALSLSGLVAGLARPVDRPSPSTSSSRAWSAIGRTVFEGDRLEEFKVHILGVLRNIIGPRRNLILARLEGGPLANTGVIAGMSGSPVYIDGRLVGAVSYSLGQFSKEPIAGITPIDEMIDGRDAARPARRQAARVDLHDAAHAGEPARLAAAGVLVGAAVRRQPGRRAGLRRPVGQRRHRHAAAADRDAAHASAASTRRVDRSARLGLPRSGLPAGDGRRRAAGAVAAASRRRRCRAAAARAIRSASR